MKVIDNVRPFYKVQICPHPTNGSGVMIDASWGCCWNSTLDRLSYLDKSGL
jgi:hypothetical protein